MSAEPELLPKPEPSDRWATRLSLSELEALSRCRALTLLEATLMSARRDVTSNDAATRARARQIVVACESQNQADEHLAIRLGQDPASQFVDSGNAEEHRFVCGEVVVIIPKNGRPMIDVDTGEQKQEGEPCS